jgi:hypothetical protein
MGQRMGQQTEQAMAIDRLTCGTHSTLLGHPDQKTTIDQSHAGTGAVFAKTAIGRSVLRKIIALHALNLINKK